MTASGRATAADGVGLWWRVDGEGPTVLLVPGRGDSTDVFPAELSDALVAAGCSVLRMDPRDTGLSDGAATPTRSPRWPTTSLSWLTRPGWTRCTSWRCRWAGC